MAKHISAKLGNAKGGFVHHAKMAILDDVAQKLGLSMASKQDVISEFKSLDCDLSNICIYCGIHPENNKHLHVDHLIPVAEEGFTILGNVVLACDKCNSKERQDNNWEQFMNNIVKYHGPPKFLDPKVRINIIHEYMTKHLGKSPDHIQLPCEIDELITELKILLDALKESIRDKIGSPQTKNVQFKTPSIMFHELIKVVEKYKIQHQPKE